MVNADDDRGLRAPYALGMQLLRRLRTRVRRMDPQRADVLLALAFLVESQMEVLLLVGNDAANAPVAALAMVPIAAGLALRRRAPLAATALVVAGFMTLQPLGREVNDNVYSMFFAVLLILFSLGAHAEGRRLWAGVGLAFLASTFGQLTDAYASTFVDYVFGGVVIAGGPPLLGRVISNRSRLNRTLREKAERLRRARADEAERAAAEERSRIAGELHDVVAHAMSAMVVQAGGARRLAERDPERAREAFAAVELTGREALTEIRRLLGVLRLEDEGIALTPQPSLRHLANMVERTRAAGLPVELAVAGDERALPPGVDLTAYRLIQEALSSALQEGGAGRANVTVRFASDALDVEVTDDGARDGTRHLPGVRERVSLYGGRLQAGRRRGGGHAVRARLPIGGAA
jgi:signal transduction histidine kinase